LHLREGGHFLVPLRQDCSEFCVGPTAGWAVGSEPIRHLSTVPTGWVTRRQPIPHTPLPTASHTSSPTQNFQNGSTFELKIDQGHSAVSHLPPHSLYIFQGLVSLHSISVLECPRYECMCIHWSLSPSQIKPSLTYIAVHCV
jgi:hypothetical protein